MVNRKLSVLFAFIAVVFSYGGGVAYPLTPVPSARFATAISYDMYGGYLYKPSISGATVTLQGFNASFTYSPITFINFGFDLGERNVKIFTHDEQYRFDGKIGFAGGTHAKFATPYFNELIGVVGFVRALWFSSETKNETYYGGMDFTGAGGLSFRVKNFGYISLGAKYFEIVGKNGEVSGTQSGSWGNEDVFGGWVSFDMFPKIPVRKHIPFFSIELCLFPGADAFDGTKPAIRNASFNLTIGAITNRLYGNSDKDWTP
ncbi:MAG: hypothetical protein LBH98_02775 [Chitinispirillales bacterium]|jgi:hypothetical protein|nr:hypothetical protein [Chitinispirillales bacterium]